MFSRRTLRRTRSSTTLTCVSSTSGRSASTRTRASLSRRSRSTGARTSPKTTSARLNKPGASPQIASSLREVTYEHAVQAEPRPNPDRILGVQPVPRRRVLAGAAAVPVEGRRLGGEVRLEDNNRPIWWVFSWPFYYRRSHPCGYLGAPGSQNGYVSGFSGTLRGA